MTIAEEMSRFAEGYGKETLVEGLVWRYYRLGTGAPILWLTGGLRRAAFGFAFLEKLAAHHTVIAPDYRPVQTVDAYLRAFDAILRAEGLERVALGGQSYGGLLAQAYLAHRGPLVERLILSSTGPADLGKGWLLTGYALLALLRVLPEQTVKDLLVGRMLKTVTLPEAERATWVEVIEAVLQRELTRADVISHFGVVADLIRKGSVRPAAYRQWTGRVVVLSAANDPTQSQKDMPTYTRLFGRPVDVLDMGDMGHAAALFDPERYVALLERALS